MSAFLRMSLIHLSSYTAFPVIMGKRTIAWFILLLSVFVRALEPTFLRPTIIRKTIIITEYLYKHFKTNSCISIENCLCHF